MPIVALVAGEDDCRLLIRVGEGQHWRVHFAGACQEAADAARRLRAPVILCDRDLPGLEWRDVVQVLATSSQGACVILVSKVLDGYLRNEVIRHGGFDVLSKPLREEDVVRAVKLARSYWNSILGAA